MAQLVDVGDRLVNEGQTQSQSRLRSSFEGLTMPTDVC
jgi:hypothetical protein